MTWYNPTEGTWVVSGEFATSSILAGSGVWIEDAKGSGNLLITYTASGAKVFSSGVLQFSTLMAPAGVVTLSNKGTLGSVKYHPRAFTDAEAIALATGDITVSFTLRNLLNNSPQGVWYDPSDLSTLFQDSAGTTPVTASGQPVGLMLDKSKGLVLGPEFLQNRDFSNGLTDWTVTTAGQTVEVVGGRLHIITDGTGAGVNQPLLTAGKTYKIEGDYEAVSGSLKVQVGSATAVVLTTTGRFSSIFRADGGNFFLYRDGGAAEGYFDNISVRELTGNHATQPTAASRPIYRRGDSRGVVNLLTRSEAFDNAAWTKGTESTVIPNTTLAPDGSMTGDTYQNTGNNREFSQTYLTPTPEGGTFTASISIKPGTLTTFGYKIRRGDTSDGITVNDIQISSGTPEPNGFYRHKLTHTFSGSTTGDNVVVLFGANFGATGNMVIHGAQLNLGPTALPYQRNDSHLGGVATGASTDLHWLETDGVDDGMVTGNIDFTGTDKVSVFTGVRKLSDSQAGTVVELSASTSVNNRAFVLNAPYSNIINAYGFVARGTIRADLTGGAIAAPHTAVVSAFANIAAVSNTIVQRRNGAPDGAISSSLGTGNFGNYPLYLFRRGGTSLPFNGWFYGLAITGRLTTDAETVATERFLAAKSAVVIP